VVTSMHNKTNATSLQQLLTWHIQRLGSDAPRYRIVCTQTGYTDAQRHRIVCTQTGYTDAQCHRIDCTQTGYTDAQRHRIVCTQTGYTDAQRNRIVCRQTGYTDAQRHGIVCTQTGYGDAVPRDRLHTNRIWRCSATGSSAHKPDMLVAVSVRTLLWRPVNCVFLMA
jgi:hypothetical protein